MKRTTKSMREIYKQRELDLAAAKSTKSEKSMREIYMERELALAASRRKEHQQM